MRALGARLEPGDGDDGMIAIDGSSYVNLTNNPADGNSGATWSPDGRRIVFNSGARLFVMNADGSGLRQITRICAGGRSPAAPRAVVAFPWSSARRKIAEAPPSTRAAARGRDRNGSQRSRRRWHPRLCELHELSQGILDGS